MEDFEIWSQAVDNLFIKQTGMGRDDFPDQCYYDMFEDGFTPSEAFNEAIENEYGQIGLDQWGIDIS